MRGRRFWIHIFAVALVAALVVECAKGAEKVQYKLKLDKGKKYYVRTVMEQKISQIFMFQAEDMEQTIGMGMDLEVNDVDANGTMWLDETYAWVKVRKKDQRGETIYDSSKKDSPVPRLMQGFAALLGEGFSLRMTPSGQVKAVRGSRRMRENISKKLLPSGRLRQFLMKDLEQHISKEAIKELTENSMAIYPDRPVGVRDSWSKTVVLSQGFAMIIKHKWTLKERKNGVAVIDVNSVVTPNRKAKPMQTGGAMSYEFSGRQWGSVQMQESTGLIAGSKINQDVSGRMQMETVDAGGEPQTMTVGLRIRGVTTTEMGDWRKDVWLYKEEEKD